MTRTQVCKCLKLCNESKCNECQLYGVENCVKLLIGKALEVVRDDTATINSLYEKVGESRAVAEQRT